MTTNTNRTGPQWYYLPEDPTDTIFDPYSDKFGPLMKALQSGEFERAHRILARLIEKED